MGHRQCQESSINASAATAHQQHQPIRSNSTLAASGHQQHQCISSISISEASAHQQHQKHQHYQRISSINASAATAHQQHQHIRSNSTLAATVHQQHQHIRSISASAATVHQQHQRLYSLLKENNHGKTYQGKMSPGQNVKLDVLLKPLPWPPQLLVHVPFIWYFVHICIGWVTFCPETFCPG